MFNSLARQLIPSNSVEFRLDFSPSYFSIGKGAVFRHTSFCPKMARRFRRLGFYFFEITNTGRNP
jgi:hypothetical protein